MFLFGGQKKENKAEHLENGTMSKDITPSKNESDQPYTKKHPCAVSIQNLLDNLADDIEEINISSKPPVLESDFYLVSADQLSDFTFNLTRFIKLKHIICNVTLYLKEEHISIFNICERCSVIINFVFSSNAHIETYINPNLFLTECMIDVESFIDKYINKDHTTLAKHTNQAIKNIPKSISKLGIGSLVWDNIDVWPFVNIKQIVIYNTLYYNYEKFTEKQIKIYVNEGITKTSLTGLFNNELVCRCSQIRNSYNVSKLKYDHKKLQTDFDTLKTEVAELKKRLADKGVNASTVDTTEPPSDTPEATSE